MITLLILAGISAVYFGTGAKVARKRYAIAMTKVVPLTEEQHRVINMRHGGLCNLEHASLKHLGCDCGHRIAWRDAKVAEKTNEIIPPYLVMGAWPVVLFDDYLKGGTAKVPNYAYIAQIEAQLKEDR